MKIETVVKPRRNGVVTVEPDGARYEFKADEAGRLVCDVSDAAHIRFMLSSGNFIPAEPDDFEAAVALAGDEDPAEPDDFYDEDFAETPNGGAPIEANTPPVARRGGRRKEGV